MKYLVLFALLLGTPVLTSTWEPGGLAVSWHADEPVCLWRYRVHQPRLKFGCGQAGAVVIPWGKVLPGDALLLQSERFPRPILSSLGVSAPYSAWLPSVVAR